MRKILIYLAILVLFYNGANAGMFGDDVDLADLSQLSPDALETLKDTEFNVFFTKVKHAGAKVLENKAGDDLKKAKLTLDSKNFHLKSAEADLKEAKATQDQGQIEAADKALHQAEEDYKQLMLDEYTFLKRPFMLIDGEAFIGNAKKTVEAAKIKLNK